MSAFGKQAAEKRKMEADYRNMNSEENLWYLNKRINSLVSCGQTASMKLEVTDFDGENRTYTRLFVPHQRLILLGADTLPVSCATWRPGWILM